nr:rhomboid family intramembrane serine protease [Parvularcula dongshanensis]
MDRSFVSGGIFNVGAVRGGQWYRMVTPAFLHADIGHLLVNMLTLYFFGPAVEVVYGTSGLAIIYLGSQLAAQGYTLYRKRDDASYNALGASGAVSGVVLAFCVFAPLAKLYLFFAIPVPAFAFGLGYVAYSSFAMSGKGRIAHEAHLGGAIGGAVLAILLPTASGPLLG